jgi:hypothetical protein
MVIAFLASSCAVYNPIPEGYSGPVASMEDTHSNYTGRSAHYFTVHKIDGKLISSSFAATRTRYYGQGMNFSPVMVSRDVLPQQAEFTLLAYTFFPTDAQSLFGNSVSVEKTFTFTPEEGAHYYVKGTLNAEAPDVWLEDASGNVIPESK